MSDWKTLAAKLAQMGLPVLGKAVGTLVGGQVPIFGNMIEGAGENIGNAAAKMIADALGVDVDAEAISNAIETAPTSDVMAKLQAAETEAIAKWPQIAAMFASMGDEYKASLADNENAREQMMRLAEASSPMAWGPVVVSVLVVIAFSFVLTLYIVRPPILSDNNVFTVVSILIGTLAAAFGQVVNFWLGSSSASKDKDHTIKAALIGAQMSPPKPITASPPPKPVKR